MSLHRHLDAFIGGFILSACKGTEKFADVQILFNFELRILNYEVENGRGKNNV